jgi:HD-GYP domain-containing protein (c-di-GMP phosphodiesterase class II)
VEQLRATGLKPGRRLAAAVYHACGEILLEPDSTVTLETIRLLDETGIDTVFRPEPGEDPSEFIRAARNQAMSVNDLSLGLRADKAIYDRTGTLLVEAGVTFTAGMINNLRQRKIDRIYVRKTGEETRADQALAFRKRLRRLTAPPPAPIPDQLDAARLLKPEDCSPRRIDAMLESEGGEVALPRPENALLRELRPHATGELRSRQAKDGFLTMYDQAVACTATVLESFQHNRDLDYDEIGQTARSVIGGLIEDRDLLLNLTNIPSTHSYLTAHSLSVTLLAISTAASRGYERKQVLEVAYAAYLHDIGMLRVDPEIVARQGKLSDAELLQIRRHPIHSLDMLQALVKHRSGLSSSIPLVAYQSHEREDSTGYPKGRSGRFIHAYAKIVAMCDAYHAMACQRPWRQAMLPYQAMEQVVLMGARRQLDPTVIRAALACISLFPIGSWVQISGGDRARVVGLAGSNYAKPVVSIVERKGEFLKTPERVNLAEHNDVQVIRAIPPPEELAEVMEAF